MKTLFILLIYILFFLEIHAQDLAWQVSPFVVFKKEMKQNADFLMIKTDRKSYRKDSIGVFVYDLRTLDTKEKFSSGSPNPRPAQEWWAWLCDRVLPEDVKQLFDLSEKRFPCYYGSMHTHLVDYGGVENEVELELCLNDDFEIIEIKLAFLEHNLLTSMSDEQLKSICKKIVECQVSIKEVFRPYDPSEYVGEKHGMKEAEKEMNKVNMYETNVFINGALKWAEVCKAEEPERWRTIVERFEKTLSVRDAEGKVVVPNGL